MEKKKDPPGPTEAELHDRIREIFLAARATYGWILDDRDLQTQTWIRIMPISTEYQTAIISFTDELIRSHDYVEDHEGTYWTPYRIKMQLVINHRTFKSDDPLLPLLGQFFEQVVSTMQRILPLIAKPIWMVYSTTVSRTAEKTSAKWEAVKKTLHKRKVVIGQTISLDVTFDHDMTRDLQVGKKRYHANAVPGEKVKITRFE